MTRRQSLTCSRTSVATTKLNVLAAKHFGRSSAWQILSTPSPSIISAPMYSEGPSRQITGRTEPLTLSEPISRTRRPLTSDSSSTLETKSIPELLHIKVLTSLIAHKIFPQAFNRAKPQIYLYISKCFCLILLSKGLLSFISPINFIFRFQQSGNHHNDSRDEPEGFHDPNEDECVRRNGMNRQADKTRYKAKSNAFI